MVISQIRMRCELAANLFQSFVMPFRVYQKVSEGVFDRISESFRVIWGLPILSAWIIFRDQDILKSIT